MNGLPRISIVTPSFNQGRYLAATLQSLVDQEYSNLEVIIQEGGSTDDSQEIARQFATTHPRLFSLYIEKDEGQADAINRGFRRASGEIMGFLNSDDLLEKDCLKRVAQEIDPDRQRYIVFGRSRFFGSDAAEQSRDHPWAYHSHFDQLAIWKREYNQIPQPSTFWHRSVWETCGEMDTDIHHAVDYDLFCRFSSRYRLHPVPEIWSYYRLHEDSKTVNKSHSDLIAECEEISRRYWGPWRSPLRWRCEVSLWLHRRSSRPEAVESLRLAEIKLMRRQYGLALLRGIIALWRSPTQVGSRLLFPFVATKGWKSLARKLRANEEFPDALCPNRWIGPYFETRLALPPNTKWIRATIEVPEPLRTQNTKTVLGFQGSIFADWIDEGTSKRIEAPIKSTECNEIAVTLCSDSYFVPFLTGENEDSRILSIRLISLQASRSDTGSI